jgi:hypothetical protein
LVFTVPQPEHFLELGNHRLAMISCPPCQVVWAAPRFPDS